ncbi:tetratricopeptide repeat protein [Thermodesulfobacteriota bacterium]
MADEGFKRKLTAILSADAVGYSRLMREDEEATVRDIASHRVIISEIIQKHHGRVIDSPGDNLLAEFASVVDAVNGAIKIQEEIKKSNANTPIDRRMEFRIGINLGDVIEEEERIYGDGVNIAARVEGLSSAGGIAISGTVYEHIKEKLSLGYHYLGEQEVKNISEPVRIYRLLTEPDDAGKMIGEPKYISRKFRYAALSALGLIILSIGALVIWNNYSVQFEPASEDKMAYPLPDKASIVVLPFVNMSDDPKQEYFSDGITETIIATLSKARDMFVIARNSAFTFKGKSMKIKQVAEELGVRYVLEGGIQKTEDRIRITVQLVDALTGKHLWTERYDRDLKDVFALQDEITLKIITALRVKLTEGEQVTLDTDNFDSYLKYLQARKQGHRWNKEGNAQAQKLIEEAIALDPEYASAYLTLSATHLLDIMFGSSKSPEQSLQTAEELVQKAISISGANADARAFLGRIYLTKGQYNKAIAEGKRAVELKPNSAFVHAALAYSLQHAGRPEEAISQYKKAIRLSPIADGWYMSELGHCYGMLGRHEEAISAFKKAISISPESPYYHSNLAANYMLIGRENKARTEIVKALEIDPKLSSEAFRKGDLYKESDYLNRLISAMRKAGLPEHPPLPLPDKPSIAVLAFDNLSGDPEQEYFSDGIAENIITALSKVGELFIIARNSSFTYKGKPVKVQQVSRELGVRYVLEGSVQKSGNRVRITAQLIDAKNGQHVWAENYDRELRDIFEIQDEITLKIVNGLQIQLTEGEHARIWSKQNCSLDAYLKAAEAQSIRHKGTKESFIRYGQIGQEIVEAEPECLMGYSILVWYNAAIAPYTKSPKKFIEKAFKYAQKGLSIDDSDPSILRNAGLVYLHKREYEKAIDMGQRAVNMAPNGAEFHAMLGFILSYAEMPDKCIDHANQAIRLDPFPQVWPHATLGRCYLLKGQYDKSLEAYRKALKISPDNTIALGGIIVAYSLLGREEDAHREAERLLELMPGLNVAFLNGSPFKNQEDRNLFIDAWLKAGIPDKRQTAQ